MDLESVTLSESVRQRRNIIWQTLYLSFYQQYGDNKRILLHNVLTKTKQHRSDSGLPCVRYPVKGGHRHSTYSWHSSDIHSYNLIDTFPRGRKVGSGQRSHCTDGESRASQRVSASRTCLRTHPLSPKPADALNPTFLQLAPAPTPVLTRLVVSLGGWSCPNRQTTLALSGPHTLLDRHPGCPKHCPTARLEPPSLTKLYLMVSGFKWLGMRSIRGAGI